MNVNRGNIEGGAGGRGRGEEEPLNITNINLLKRLNNTREIFSIVTRVFSILLTTARTSAIKSDQTRVE